MPDKKSQSQFFKPEEEIREYRRTRDGSVIVPPNNGALRVLSILERERRARLAQPSVDDDVMTG